MKRKLSEQDGVARIGQIIVTRNLLAHFPPDNFCDFTKDKDAWQLANIVEDICGKMKLGCRMGFANLFGTPIIVIKEGVLMKVCEITAPYQVIVCEEIFKNPVISHSAVDIFERFKKCRKEKDGEIWHDKFERQVEAAVANLNKGLIKALDLKEPPFVYQETSKPQVFLSRAYFI